MNADNGLSEPGQITGNAAVMRDLFQQLDTLGVQEYCVCAGARNATIIAALVARGAVIYHFYDERSAGFFALGRIMVARRPVAVLTTSGTAVAELLPAMVESYYQGLPLIAITADRPSRYSGSGAPQAIEQPGIFGIYAPHSRDLAWGGGAVGDTVLTGVQGPVHLNVRLEEGLLPESLTLAAPAAAAPAHEESLDTTSTQHAIATLDDFLSAEGPLLVLAAGIHPQDVGVVAAYLETLGAPIVAEATANLEGIPALQPLLRRGGEQALAQSTARRVLRIGSVPSWRWWRDLEDRPEIRVCNISPAGFHGLARTAWVEGVPWRLWPHLPVVRQGMPPDAEDTGRVARLDTALAAHPLAEPSWMRHLSQCMGVGCVTLLGNSLPIREWNLAAAPLPPTSSCYACRGANGIDGQVSAWLGASLSAGESWLIVGDLTALYDLGAAWVLPQLPVGKRRWVVINNSGGQIFSSVAWLNELPAQARAVMVNPHGLSFAPIAQMWGLEYACIRTLADLAAAQANPAANMLWEIQPDAAQTAAFWQAWRRTQA